MNSFLTNQRSFFHQALVDEFTLCVDRYGVASNADKSQRSSREIAHQIALKLGAREVNNKLQGQTVGGQFESTVRAFLGTCMPRFPMLRPGQWRVENVGGSRGTNHVAQYEPYRHLNELANAIKAQRELSAVLGNSYEISPDVLVVRSPESDKHINAVDSLVDGMAGTGSVIRGDFQPHDILHAVVSCKWTLRSDRAQNARSEALNIIRNRKGRTPHIAVVTGEPSPSRLASLALGTGDIDMVYHFALPELIEAVEATGNDEAISMLTYLVEGKRLRDIADLPLDLTV